MTKFKFFGEKVINQNYVHEKIKIILNSGKASYHAVQKHFMSTCPSKILNVKIYKTVVLPLLLYVVETWSLTSVRLYFENRVAKRYFELRRRMYDTEENQITRSFIICTLHRYY